VSNDTDVDADNDADTDTNTDTDSHPSSDKWVMGYYVGYQRSLYPPESVQYEAMTHLAIGAIVPVADGSIETHFYLTGTQGPQLVDDLTVRAHAAGVKVIGMLGGAGTYDGFAGAASDEHRATFVQNLLAFARDAHGMDGLDLDWEPLYPDDFAPFTALVEALREAWPEAILTFPIGYLNPNYQTPDPFYAEIAPLLDQVNIMSYGMAGTYSGWESWHSSALDGEGATTPTSVSSTVYLYLEHGMPADKLGLL
jgi:chitinase